MREYGSNLLFVSDVATNARLWQYDECHGQSTGLGEALSDGMTTTSNGTSIMSDAKTIMSDSTEAFWEAIEKHIDRAQRGVPGGHRETD